MEIQYRPATAEDARDISGLIHDLSASFLANPDGSDAQLFWDSVSENAQSQRLQDPRYCYTVAMKNKQLAGFIAMRDHSHVFHLFVAKRHQRQGLASQLWERARSDARDVKSVDAFTVNSSLTAVVVYERFGFVRTGETVTMHGISFCPMRRPFI